MTIEEAWKARPQTIGHSTMFHAGRTDLESGCLQCEEDEAVRNLMLAVLAETHASTCQPSALELIHGARPKPHTIEDHAALEERHGFDGPWVLTRTQIEGLGCENRT